MSLLILVVVSALCLFIRSRLSVENPGKLQLALEEAVSFLYGMVDDFIGPKGRNYVTLVGTMFIFILLGNLMGLVPGLKAPTSSINVTLGCALTVFVYYQFHGIKEQGIVSYVKHFMMPPGRPRPGSRRSTSRSRSSATCRACCRSRSGCSATSSARTWSSSSSPAWCRSWCRCR